MSRRAWIAFAAASVIWGIPYLFIKIAIRGGVTPPALAWARVTLAAIVLLGLAWRAGTLGTLRGRWLWLLGYAVAEISIPFPLIAAGEEHVASSLAAIIIASVPLIGAGLALRFDHSERPTPLRALGLMIGFSGVIALVGIDVAGRSGELLGTAAILLAAVGYAIGPMIIKHGLAGIDPRAPLGASLAIASLILAPFAALDPPRVMPSAGALAAVAVLGLVCTAAAFVIFTVLVHEAGTSRATVITYVNPVVAVALGVALLGERPGAGAVAGLLLILAGSWLSTGGRLPPQLRPWALAAKRPRLGSGRITRSVRVGAMAGLGLCALAVPAAASIPAWTTYHRDALRSGVDPDSSSPLPPVQRWQTPSLDGQIYGQPLVYGSRVYVATENDTVYAFDAASGQPVWHEHVGTPVPDVATAGCGDIGNVGITGTPVIDPASGRIYAVLDTWDGTHKSSVHHRLVGFNLADGSPAPGLPIAVDPPIGPAASLLQRAALALDAGRIVIGYGGNAGDCGNYHGWLVSAPESGVGSLLSFEVDFNAVHGAIWGAGNGPAVDGAGNIWVATGNGSSVTFGFQESVVRLGPNLRVRDHWAPSDWQALDSADADLGSSDPLLLPGGLVFQIGKQGIGYLLASSALGGTGGTPVYQSGVCSGSFGGGVYRGGVIYVACSDGLHALALNLATRSFTAIPGWRVTAAAVGPPIIAGGLVWSVGWHDGRLFGLDLASGAVKFDPSLGSFNHFASPSAAGGGLFVANGAQVTGFTIAATRREKILRVK